MIIYILIQKKPPKFRKENKDNWFKKTFIYCMVHYKNDIGKLLFPLIYMFNFNPIFVYLFTLFYFIFFT